MKPFERYKLRRAVKEEAVSLLSHFNGLVSQVIANTWLLPAGEQSAAAAAAVAEDDTGRARVSPPGNTSILIN